MTYNFKGDEGTRFLDHAPFWGPIWLELSQNYTYTTRPPTQQYETISKSLGHIPSEEIGEQDIVQDFWTTPLLGPHGVRTGPNLHMHNWTSYPTL